MRLSVESSAVNRQILGSRRRWGVALFERAGAAYDTTAAGELPARHVRETQNDNTAHAGRDREPGRHGVGRRPLRIHLAGIVLVRFLPQVVERRSAKHPQGDLSVLAGIPANRRGAAPGDNDFECC